MTNLFGTIESLSAAYAKQQLKPSKVVDAHLQAIEKHNAHIDAYQTVFFDQAMQAAAAADKAFMSGYRIGPFHGIPFALKDIYDLEGHICTNGSMALKDRVSPKSGTVVRRLIAAGGIVLGKSKTVESAFGGWGTNQKMGTPWNPWDLKNHRIPGGSSSGSGVATAAGLAVCGIGSDTGGSVRLPAAYCGITGLKVTEGQLPCDGIAPLAQTLDSPGPMTQTVTDTVMLYEIMMGREGGAIDDDMRTHNGLYQMLAKGVRGLKLGQMAQSERANCTADILAGYDQAIDSLQRLGADIEVFSSPFGYASLADDNGAITAVEAYNNHGHLYEDKTAPMDEDVRKRMLTGKTYLAHEYVRMLETRRQRCVEFNEAISGFDAILTPSMTSTAPIITDVDQAISPGHFTRPFNYLAMCGLSVPTGLASDGMPLSLQIIARAHDEAMAIRIGAAVESVTASIGRAPL
ncbi:amidase [Candidatus Puniceispirillum marinum]|uniref:Amidase n=1 Tax=Puniceispirillum marinum (strain IMCC1322) TaxID=488538 RepID=D5BRE5_PUNMI|nr:amidase [Candidatus Puniceispirillum marinum]ADE38842.1 Amidase [Candidatus Puniceispirillum marinum IMCC1322]